MSDTKMNSDEARRYEKALAVMSASSFVALFASSTEQEAQERINKAQAFVDTLPYNPLQDELDSRHSDPHYTRMSMQELKDRLKDLGYRLDPNSKCYGVSRWMTGPRAGKSYPECSLRPVQIDDGLAAVHYQARRDANFEALQALRLRAYVSGARAIFSI